MELDLFYINYFMKERHSFESIPCAGSWLQRSACCQHHSERYGESFSGGRENNDDDLHFMNCVRNHSQLSTTSSNMSKKCSPMLVYQRRRKNKPSDDAKSNDGTTLTDQYHLAPVSECALESIETPEKNPTKCITPKTPLNRCSSDENSASEEVLVDTDRVLNVCGHNDDCSSSVSDLKCSTASLEVDLDHSVRCPSSDPMLAEKIPEEMSERDICITILRSQGLLDTLRTGKDQSSLTANANGASIDNYCLMSCKICARVGSTSRMLLCDTCEDAFHISCCSTQIIPNGEWHCDSCVKKKHVKLKERSINDLVNNINDGLEIDQDSASQGNLGSLGFMFTETEPYMSNVRVGDEYQASVPDWCGPCDDKGDLPGGPTEMNYSNIVLEEPHLTKSTKLSSIGNWIQCRAVLEGIGEGVDGTSCAKWRRAPLFEVQTDNWECFRCVLWDPAHADCAVPQELSTEEIMRQLKYIELLRPRLAAKRRKFVCSGDNDLQEHTLKSKQHQAAKKKKLGCSNNIDPQNRARS